MIANSSLSKRIESIDRATLTPIVQRATHCRGILTHWQATQIHATSGGLSPSLIYRFSGGMEDSTQERKWTLVLKVTSPAIHTDAQMSMEVDDISREYEFYRSDLAYSFPAGFRAAQSYAAWKEISPSGQPQCWIWLEDMARNPSNQWSLDEVYQVALGLGKFNGAYLNNIPQPVPHWLKRNQIRKYLQKAEPYFQRLFALHEMPVICTLFPPDLIDSLKWLWQARERHLALLERLPQTLCHGDAQFSNLFLVPTSGGAVETVAIDWAAIGIGPLGQDLAQFLMLRLFYAEPSEAQDFEAALFKGYLDGIRTSGWQGDPRLVRLGFTAAMLKVQATGVLRIMENFTEDGLMDSWLKRWLQTRNLTLEEWAESFAMILRFTRKLFEEALDLRAQLVSD